MTIIIIVLTSIVSLLAFNNSVWFDKLKFNAYFVKHSNEKYRLLSYGLIHADWVHLIVNMFVLYSFGRVVELFFTMHFEEKAYYYYGLLYLGGIALSVLAAFGKHKDNILYNAVGASGAVSAVVFSSIVLYPVGKITFIFLPIPISSPVFGLIYLVYSYFMSKKAQDNIGHDAHFWGAIFGVVFTIALKPELFLIFIKQLFG